MAKIPYMRDGILYYLDNEGNEQAVTGTDVYINFHGVDLSNSSPVNAPSHVPDLLDMIETIGDHKPYVPEDEPQTMSFTVTYDNLTDLSEKMVYHALDVATRNQDSPLVIASMSSDEAEMNYKIARAVLEMLDKDETEAIALITKLADDLKTLYRFD